MILQGTFILIGFISLLLLLGLPVYYYIRYRHSNKAWKSIQKHLGFEEESSYKLTGSWNGQNFIISYHPSSRHERASLTITLSCSIEELPTGTLRVERWWDKLGKTLGLAKEFQSLSNVFNESVYIESNDKNFENLIRDPSFRRIVTSMFESRFSRVRMNRGYHTAGIEWSTKIYHGFWKKLTPSRLKNIFSSLIDLRECIENKELRSRHVFHQRREKPSPSKLIAWLGYGIPVASIFLGIGLFFWGIYYPTFSYQLQLTGLKIAGVILLVYVPVGYLCFRGGSTSHKNFFGFLLCAAFGLPLFMIGILTTMNGFLDESPSVWQKAKPVELRYEDGDYHVTVSTIHNGIQGEPELDISEQMYNQLRNRNEVFIKVKDGFLSEPWVSDIQLNR